MSPSIPDYTDDWKNYWEFKHGNRAWKKLESAAKYPTSQFLPVKPTELNPEQDKYDWSIENDHLREDPDRVLRDARSGFAEFVSDNDIAVDEDSKYDILPINFTDRSWDLVDYFFNVPSMKRLPTNEISSIKATLHSPLEISRKAAVISYQCPSDHQNRILQPIYTNRLIDRCAEDNCTNSVYQISRGTQLIDIVEFKIEFDDSKLQCVANGLYTTERKLEELRDGDQGVQLHGILRNVVSDEGDPNEIFEVLNMDN